MSRALARTIEKHDRLERELKKTRLRLRTQLQKHQDKTGRGGLPKLDVVRAEMKRAGMIR